MTSSRNSLLALLLATSAFAAPRPASPNLETLVRDSRAAYFRGDYDDCMRMAMEVIVQEPGDAEARDLLRLSAKVLSERRIDEVQEERKRLVESAHAIRGKQVAHKQLETELKLKEKEEFQTRLEAAEKARPSWSSWARSYVAQGDFLEAYRLVFLVKDQFPNEQWPVLQLERLERVVERETVSLAARPAWYRESVAAYQSFAAGKYDAAVDKWTAALKMPGVDDYGNREALERRLDEAWAKGTRPRPKPVKKPKASRKVAAAKPAAPRPPVAPPAPPPPKPGEIETLYVGGLVQYGMGHVGEAVRTWEKVLELDPKHPAARRAVERARRELSGGKP